MLNPSGDSHSKFPSLLTPYDVVKRFHISRSGVYRLVEQRAIPFYKVGHSLRFAEEDLLAYLEKNRVKPITPDTV